MEDETKSIEIMRGTYYSAMFNAWANTRMERDRSVLVISSAAIGFLVTLASKSDLTQPYLVLLYLADMAFFVVAIGVVICIFARNSQYLGKIIKTINAGGDRIEEIKDGLLSALDIVLVSAFSLGIVILLTIACVTILQISNKQVRSEVNMVEDGNSGGLVKKSSLDGAAKLYPGGSPKPEKKSLDGAAELFPKPVVKPDSKPADKPAEPPKGDPGR